MKSHEIDMVHGSLFPKLIQFSIPLMISGILQLLFNAIDMVVVGRFSGNAALAAIGSTSALVYTMTNLFTGLSLGTNIEAAKTMVQAMKKRCTTQFTLPLRWQSCAEFS